MKSAYEILKSDKEINYILDNTNYNLNRLLNFVNETSAINYTYCCHGRHHTLYVVDLISYILNALSYDSHTIELGKIAGLLHDIGNYYGRNDHARVSASMCLHFVSKTNLKLDDLKIIEQAVLDHSKGMDIKSAVGAALLIADKVTDKERGNPVKADLIKGGFNNEAELNKYELNPSSRRNTKYTVTDFQFYIQDRDLIYNYFVEGDTEFYVDEYIIKKKKPIRIINKNAADYLKCNCIYKVNGYAVETKL